MIMVLFVLHKLILQTRIRSYRVGLDVWFLVGPFVFFHTSCLRTAKALARLRGCTDSPEPSLVAYVISTIISWAALNVVFVHTRLLNYLLSDIWLFVKQFKCQDTTFFKISKLSLLILPYVSFFVNVLKETDIKSQPATVYWKSH